MTLHTKSYQCILESKRMFVPTPKGVSQMSRDRETHKLKHIVLGQSIEGKKIKNKLNLIVVCPLSCF